MVLMMYVSLSLYPQTKQLYAAWGSFLAMPHNMFNSSNQVLPFCSVSHNFHGIYSLEPITAPKWRFPSSLIFMPIFLNAFKAKSFMPSFAISQHLVGSRVVPK